jgi:prepilin-type N-terminal cleavage/methylation domain-containing protein
VIRRLHRDQSGFTLTELIVSMSLGLIVLMAALMLFDRATKAADEIADRQDAVQRGRLAMEAITRQLRSQVCLGETTEPINYGDPDTVRFYADLSDGSGIRNVEQRQLRFDPVGQEIVETVQEGEGEYPKLTFPAEPTSTRVQLTKAAHMKEDGVTRPLFRYFGFKAGGAPGELEELPVPLNSDDASRVVMVRVAFFARPERRIPQARDSTSLQSDVYVRLADPSRPTEGPRCL